jgi:hypothetical protein
VGILPLEDAAFHLGAQLKPEEDWGDYLRITRRLHTYYYVDIRK